MIDKLTRLVGHFTSGDERPKSGKLDGVGICSNEPRTGLPSFSDEVNQYIKEKARRDLPQAQFDNTLSLNDLGDWVEIGGILGYRKHPYEMCYYKSDSSQVRLRDSPNGRELVSSTMPMVLTYGQVFMTKLLDKAMIDWHSHPKGSGELSPADLVHQAELVNDFPELDIYSVVFLPAKNQAVWYQAKKAQPK